MQNDNNHSTHDTNNNAKQAIRNLLDGKPPGDITPDQCGPWAEIVEALNNAYSANGTEGVKSVFNALCKATPTLAELMASDPPPKNRSGWSVSDLLSTEFPEPNWVVPGLIPEGLTILAGRPKVGKSWFALQVGTAVGSGGMVFDKRVVQGRVLYLALEDSYRRLKERLQKQRAVTTTNMFFETEWPGLDEGGLTLLEQHIEKNQPKVVFFDTISRVLRKSDQNNGQDMGRVLGDLQRLAIDHHIGIILIDHHKKSGGEGTNPIDDILGATAKTAVADATLGLFRDKGERRYTLKATGREIEEQSLNIAFDGATGCWQLLGETGGTLIDTNRHQVLTKVKALFAEGHPPTTAHIAERLNMDPGNVNRILADLTASGEIIRGKKLGKEQPYYPANK
ncbi:MAG: AAA family ATPase [Caldilineaceae bacterium]|nr:AAA family ATPase [Caldilineaceae bacterium]